MGKNIKETIRRTLKSDLDLRYIFKKSPVDPVMIKKELFVKILNTLEEIEDRRIILESETGIELKGYDEPFYDIINNLLKMNFSDAQIDLIHMYLYELSPVPEWDGTIMLKKPGKKPEKTRFSNPAEVFDVIQKIK